MIQFFVVDEDGVEHLVADKGGGPARVEFEIRCIDANGQQISAVTKVVARYAEGTNG